MDSFQTPRSILLLTKNYPPQIGGIEKYAYDLYHSLQEKVEEKEKQRNDNNSPLKIHQSRLGGIEGGRGGCIKLIAAGPRNEWLLTKKGSRIILFKVFFKALYIVSEIIRLAWFMIRSFMQGLLWARQQHGPVLIWSLDGSIAWIGFSLAWFVKKVKPHGNNGSNGVNLGNIVNSVSTRVTLHGTDVVWNKKLYQAVMPRVWKNMDEVYVISENTKLETLGRGIPPNRITLVPHTQDSLTFVDPGDFDKAEFLQSLGIPDPQNKVILFSIGRWIERKGFHWFLENVMPGLDPSRFFYILAGFGPLESQHNKIISERKLGNIVLVGKVDELTKARLFKSSDLFIMPNIEIAGDIEGFGLVLLEAEHYGLKIIASKVDGIESRLTKEDVCLPYGDPDAWSYFFLGHDSSI